MFVIGQDLKGVHVTYYFDELLIFYWSTQFSVTNLIPHWIKETLPKIQTLKETNEKMKYIFSCLRCL